MGRCYTLLILSALLVSSMSAPALSDTGGTKLEDGTKPENGTKLEDGTKPEDGAKPEDHVSSKPTKTAEPNPAPKEQSHSGEIGKLIQKFARIFDTLTLGDLKLLEKTIGDKKDLSEFEGLLGVLADDGGENVYSMLDQLKGHYTLLHGILRGKISRKEKPNSVSNSPGTKEPSKKPLSQSNGQSSSQNEVKSQLDGAVEKIVEQQLMAAMKTLPIDDLEKLQSMLADKSDPSQALKEIQLTFPKLTDDLIKITVKYPSELKAVIEQVLLENKLKSVTPAATTAQPSEPTSQVMNDSKQDNENKNFKAENKKIDMKISDETKGEDISTKDGKDEHSKGGGNTDDGSMDDSLLYVGEPNKSANQGIQNDNHDNDDQHQDEEKLSPPGEDKKTKSQNDSKNTPEQSGGWFGAWHFLIIFLVIAALVGVGYYCSHNRKKIRAGVGSYISDASSKGRRSRNYRYKPVSST